MAGNLSLEIGKRALIAQSLGLDVTSSNIANVNTPGYSRRQAVISETTPLNSNGSFLGTGAMVDKLRSFREDYFDKEVRSSSSRLSSYESDDKLVQRLETILSEPSDNGINEKLTDFFNTFEDLSVKPEDQGIRSTLLQKARTLVDTFHSISGQIASARSDVLSNIGSDVNIINDLTKQIADLNIKISLSKVQSGAEFQSLVDRRESKLEELAKLSDITVTKGNVGSVNVFINGINIVTGPESAQLKLQENTNPATGESTIVIGAADKSGNIQNYLSPQNGELSSLLKHYNVTFDGKDSSGGLSVAKQLNDLASALVNKINSLTVGGYGLNDTSAPPAGRNFFDPVVGPVTADNIEISAALANNPANIPLSDAPGEPGSNAIALKLAKLKNDSTFVDGMTPSEFYSSLIEKVGSMGSDAVNGKSSSSLLNQQLTSQRDSVIGVNLDEEAVNIIKFQKAFEASSRIISTTSELLTTIINLGK